MLEKIKIKKIKNEDINELIERIATVRQFDDCYSTPDAINDLSRGGALGMPIHFHFLITMSPAALSLGTLYAAEQLGYLVPENSGIIYTVFSILALFTVFSIGLVPLIAIYHLAYKEGGIAAVKGIILNKHKGPVERLLATVTERQKLYKKGMLL